MLIFLWIGISVLYFIYRMGDKGKRKDKWYDYLLGFPALGILYLIWYVNKK